MNNQALPWLPVRPNLNTIMAADATKIPAIGIYITSVTVFTNSFPNEVATNTVSPVAIRASSIGVCKPFCFCGTNKVLSPYCLNEFSDTAVVQIFNKFCSDILDNTFMGIAKNGL